MRCFAKWNISACKGHYDYHNVMQGADPKPYIRFPLLKLMIRDLFNDLVMGSSKLQDPYILNHLPEDLEAMIGC